MNTNIYTIYLPLLNCKKAPSGRSGFYEVSRNTDRPFSQVATLSSQVNGLLYIAICFKGDHQSLNLDAINLETRTSMKDVIYHE
jgi:hypothetical protein